MKIGFMKIGFRSAQWSLEADSAEGVQCQESALSVLHHGGYMKTSGRTIQLMLLTMKPS